MRSRASTLSVPGNSARRAPVRGPAGGVDRGRRAAGVLTWGPRDVAAPLRRWAVQVLVVAGAALLVVSAAIHLNLWNDGYRGISVIGPLFLAQSVVGLPLAVATAALRRLALIVSAAGTLIATAAGLLLSVYVGLFGFRDSLTAPDARLSLIVEFTGATVLLIAAVLLVVGRLAGARREGTRHLRRGV